MQTHRELLSDVKVEGGSECRLQPRWLSGGHIPLTSRLLRASSSILVPYNVTHYK